VAKDQSRNINLVVPAVLLAALILSFYTPFPLINSDSVHGFEVMNGYYWTGKWNTTLLFNDNTHLLYEKFLTWWSPGQWMVPMFFIKVFHLKIGSALVLINFLCTSLGTIGYFLVFKKYGFDRSVIWISVTGILLSSPVLPGFYYYAGGESLNFMIFPWIIVMQNLLVRKFWKFIFPGLILFISFLCKLQMLIVVPPLLFLLVFTQKEDLNFGSRPRLRNYLPFFISVIPILLLIYFNFISSGDTPLHSIKQFSPNLVNFLFPLASPFISVYFFDTLHYFLFRNSILGGAYLFIMSVILILCMGHAVRHFSEYEPVKKKYIFLVFIL
jgi:hypothetical protein